MARRFTRGDRSGGQDGSQDRGQTTQDFAIGIGIFILAVAGVFIFLPTVAAPFETGGGAQTAQADRIADRIVADGSPAVETPNELNQTAFNETYDDGDLEAALGLREEPFDRVNVTVANISEDDPLENSTLSAGTSYDDEPGASTDRIVTTDDPTACEPACTLTVRVW